MAHLHYKNWADGIWEDWADVVWDDRDWLSFEEFQDMAVSEKIFLAEINPAEQLSGWHLTSGQTNTYSKNLLNETITLADGTTENIRKEYSSVEENGAALTEQASIALVEANAGSWFNDLTGGTQLGDFAPTSCCTDPDDDQDNTTGWTAASATLASEAGGITGNRLKVSATSSNGMATKQNLTLIEGRKYGFKAKAGADVGDEYRVYIRSISGGIVECDTGTTAGAGAGNWDTIDETFICSSTQTDYSIRLIAVNNTDNAYFDDVELYEISQEGDLFIHTSGSDDPDGYTILGFFWLYFATKGIILNSKYYEPYIADKGVPNLTQSNPNLYWGVSTISGGSLKLLNNRGYFDQISKKFIWTNKKVKILLGGDSLIYGEYDTLYTGRIVNKNFTKQIFKLEITSMAFNLMQKLPLNKFWISDYPNLDPDAEGRPIPYYYGSYTVAQAPVVTCINTAYASNTYQFKICDHAIKSITQVYYDLDDGNGWQSIGHANEDLTNATFTIVLASFVVGTTKVKVAFDGKHSGGTLYEKGPHIVEDLLTNVLGYAARDLLASSFTASKNESNMILNVPIETETEALTIIERICQSDMAFFDEDADGKLRYRTWKPYYSGAHTELKDYDFLDIPQVTEDNKQLYSKVSIGYSYYCSTKEYLYHDETSTESEYKYGRSEQLKLDTYIRGSADATILGQRLKLLMKDPTTKLKVKLKLPVIDQLLGDKVQITMARSPFSESSGWDKRYFEINSRRINCFPVINSLELFDLKEFGSDIGYWTSDTAVSWSTASDAQKAVSGFWCDSSGYADPADSESKGVSNWW